MTTQTYPTTTESKQTIVLARMVDGGVKEHETETEKRDGILKYKLVFFQIPKALVWLNEGDADDLEKAKAHADKEGFSVFTYPTSEKDPIGKAKLAVQASK